MKGPGIGCTGRMHGRDKKILIFSRKILREYDHIERLWIRWENNIKKKNFRKKTMRCNKVESTDSE
jgi:hypothetical protein